MTLFELGAIATAASIENGWDPAIESDWNDTYRIPAKIGLLHSEVSEALEAFRNNDRKNFNEELADVLLRLLDISHGFGIDLETEVLKKIEKNKSRGYRHGGKRL